MKFSAFAIFAAAAIGAAAASSEIEAADSEHLADFWSKFDGWKWNCTHAKAKENENADLEASIEGTEPEWLMTEWVNKMMGVKHNKHNLTDYESGKLTKMWGVCDWFKGKKNHTKTYKEEAEEADAAEMDVAVAEKADEEFLMDFWHACSAWKKNKTWTWGYAKKNFTWFSKGNKEGELTAEIEN